jgi:DNA-binding response OmpR family regulator
MGFIALAVESAAQAIAWLTHGAALVPDLVLFDEAGQDMSPSQFAKAMADMLSDRAPPVIYILESERGAAELTSPSFRAGRDTFLLRPVRERDVFRALLMAHSRLAEKTSVLHAEGLELDVGLRLVHCGGRNVHLTRLECRLLEYLMRSEGRVVRPDELLERVWGFQPGTGGGEVLRAHLRNLRRKLAFVGVAGDVILTLPGRGYRFLDASARHPPAAGPPLFFGGLPDQ